MIKMEERTKVVIYARVSTSTQDYTRQITELRKYAKKQNYEIVKEFSEKISGGKKVEERTAIKEILVFIGFTSRLRNIFLISVLQSRNFILKLFKFRSVQHILQKFFAYHLVWNGVA